MWATLVLLLPALISAQQQTCTVSNVIEFTNVANAWDNNVAPYYSSNTSNYVNPAKIVAISGNCILSSFLGPYWSSTSPISDSNLQSFACNGDSSCLAAFSLVVTEYYPTTLIALSALNRCNVANTANPWRYTFTLAFDADSGVNQQANVLAWATAYLALMNTTAGQQSFMNLYNSLKIITTQTLPVLNSAHLSCMRHNRYMDVSPTMTSYIVYSEQNKYKLDWKFDIK
jgi:hypothetical protein